MRERIYLAGPMSGLPFFNYPAFHAAAKNLREQGYEVFNPAEIPDNENMTIPDLAEIELGQLIRNTDIIAMLPDWENSRGARAEHAVANWLKLKIMYLR